MTFVKIGATSVSRIVLLVDDSGIPVTGKVASTFPSTRYVKSGETVTTIISLVDLVGPTYPWTSGGVLEVTEGRYRLDVPDAAFSTTCELEIFGEATNLHLIAQRIDVGMDLSGTSVKLTSDGLDSISTTAPSGVASNFREMMVQLWRRFFKKATQTSSELKTYADNGSTVITTQAVSDVSGTETQGAAS